ncbi:MAG TPA: thermonuclease family protein [Steroidobacteraceae bacterium]|nr:thermonuclease family protein [Steroidobacteraceae bacterium]
MHVLRSIRALAMAVPLAGIASVSPAAHATDPPRTVLPGVVVGVVDGDTADVRLASGMIRIRFHAIDAPESGQPHGAAARRALSDLVFGRQVDVEPFEQDRYDRLVARLWVGDLDVNAEMIRTGNAWTYRRYAGDPAYCAHEKAARDLSRGLWHLPVEQRAAPWEWRQRKSRGRPFTDYTAETVAECIASLGR